MYSNMVSHDFHITNTGTIPVDLAGTTAGAWQCGPSVLWAPCIQLQWLTWRIAAHEFVTVVPCSFFVNRLRCWRIWMEMMTRTSAKRSCGEGLWVSSTSAKRSSYEFWKCLLKKGGVAIEQFLTLEGFLGQLCISSTVMMSTQVLSTRPKKFGTRISFGQHLARDKRETSLARWWGAEEFTLFQEDFGHRSWYKQWHFFRVSLPFPQKGHVGSYEKWINMVVMHHWPCKSLDVQHVRKCGMIFLWHQTFPARFFQPRRLGASSSTGTWSKEQSHQTAKLSSGRRLRTIGGRSEVGMRGDVPKSDSTTSG